MYQPSPSGLFKISANKYNVYFEETRWTLNSGACPWFRIEEPLEIESEKINDELRKLNIENIEYIIQDYKELTGKIVSASIANINSGKKYKER